MSELLNELTEAQRAAVTHLNGPALVVAGPGTGKTKVITSRIAYLVQEQGIAAESITALTFTDKAAREMEERVDKLLPYGITGVTCSTFHSFCFDLLKRHSMLLGMDPGSALMGSAEEIAFLRQHLDELPTSLYKPSRNPVELLRLVTNFMSKCQDEYLSPEQVIEHAKLLVTHARDEGKQEEAEKMLELGLLYAKAQQLYRDNSLLTYGDLIYHTVTLLKNHPSVIDFEGDRVQYLLVDEFQDTNFAQSEVARLLCQNHRNLMVVGDDDQAIYSFRGANLGNILTFTTTFPEAVRITLTDNFRSSQPILDMAHRVIQFNNPERLEADGSISKRLTSHSEHAVAPKHLHFERSIFEAQAIANSVQNLLNEGFAAEDIAILVRSKTQVASIEEALSTAGIESQFSGDLKFYHQRPIKIACAFLRFLAQPHNDLNLFFLMSAEPLCVEERTLHRFLAKARYETTSLYDYLLTLEDETELQLQEVKTYLQGRLIEASQFRPSQLLLHFIQSSKWLEQLHESGGGPTMDLLFSLYSTLHTQESSGQLHDIREYVQHLDYLLATDEEVPVPGADVIPNGVQIMTVHKSKGLEFRAVFVTNLAQGRFPSRNFRDSFPFPYELTNNPTKGSTSNLAEERRLFYVAATRAKERLFLTSSEQYGESRIRSKLSPFVTEALGLVKPPVAESAPFETLVPRPITITQPKVPKTEKFIIPVAKSHSVSALETYQACPLRYKWQYVLKIRTPASLVSNFGTSMHRALQLWYEFKKRGDVPNLQEIFKSSWVPGGYVSKAFERQRYEEGLAKFEEYLNSQPEGLIPTQLEYNFQAHFDGDILVTGKVDRVDPLPNGKVRVIDYKTGEHPPEMRELVDNLQLVAYSQALSQQGMEVDCVELHYLMVGETLSAPVETLSTAAVLAGVSSTVQQITESAETGIYPAKPSRLTCSYCDFRDICPFRFGS